MFVRVKLKFMIKIPGICLEIGRVLVGGRYLFRGDFFFELILPSQFMIHNWQKKVVVDITILFFIQYVWNVVSGSYELNQLCIEHYI